MILEGVDINKNKQPEKDKLVECFFHQSPDKTNISTIKPLAYNTTDEQISGFSSMIFEEGDCSDDYDESNKKIKGTQEGSSAKRQ